VLGNLAVGELAVENLVEENLYLGNLGADSVEGANLAKILEHENHSEEEAG